MPIHRAYTYSGSNATFHDAKNMGYPCFSGADRRKLITRTNYFFKVCERLKFNPSRICINDIFPEGNKIPERKELNRRAVEASYLSKPLTVPVPIELDAGIQRKLGEMQWVFSSSKKLLAKERIDSRITRVKDLQAEQMRQFSEIRDYTRQIDTMEDKKVSVAGPINKLLAEGFYSLNSISLNEVRLDTVNIIVSCVDKEKAYEQHVELGRFTIWLRFNDFRCSIKPHKDNSIPRCGEYYHPFVSAGGEPCFGNENLEACAVIAEGDLYKYLRLLENLLTSYDINSNPYAPLHRFAEVQQAQLDAIARSNPQQQQIDDEARIASALQQLNSIRNTYNIDPSIWDVQYLNVGPANQENSNG